MSEKIFDFDIENSSGNLELLDIKEPLKGFGRYIVQTRCPSDVGIIEIEVSSFSGTNDFRVVWKVTNEEIPIEFSLGVIEGVKRWAEKNGLRGLQIEVVDGKHHLVDSRNHSYKMAMILALDNAFEKIKI